MTVLVYTRQGCHLCDQAADLIRDRGVEAELIDIDLHPELQEKYTACVPVVVIDGRVRFRGRVNPVLLQRIIDA